MPHRRHHRKPTSRPPRPSVQNSGPNAQVPLRYPGEMSQPSVQNSGPNAQVPLRYPGEMSQPSVRNFSGPNVSFRDPAWRLDGLTYREYHELHYRDRIAAEMNRGLVSVPQPTPPGDNASLAEIGSYLHGLGARGQYAETTPINEGSFLQAHDRIYTMYNRRDFTFDRHGFPIYHSAPQEQVTLPRPPPSPPRHNPIAYVEEYRRRLDQRVETLNQQYVEPLNQQHIEPSPPLSQQLSAHEDDVEDPDLPEDETQERPPTPISYGFPVDEREPIYYTYNVRENKWESCNLPRK